MTRYSRSVIPGRSGGEPLTQEMDAMVFGRKGRARSAANDRGDFGDDFAEDEADHLVERATADRRGTAADRRKAKTRRKSDFTPLPQEGSAYRAPQEGSKRGPVLLIGALVIVGVFGVVVWNAYRDGVRPEDSNTAPQLAQAGAFKTKPDAAAETSASRVEASVFEQVESRRPVVAPAPEVRLEPKASPVAAPPAQTVVKPPVQTAASAPARPPVTQPAAAKAAPAPAGPTATPAPTQPAPVQTPVQTAAAPKPAALAPAPAATVPAPLQTAAAPAPEQEAISLIGAPTYTPVFVKDGKYVVQIAAASSEAGANAEWDKRVKASPELFPAAAEKIVVQADVNGRTVYRVRVGAFGAAENAEGFCDAIKAKGGACFRTAR
jgi:hypothetical protein